VITSEAKGTDYGSGTFSRQLSVFTGHAGWKGFFHPKNETPDGKHDKKSGAAEKKETPQEKFKRLMNLSSQQLKQYQEYNKKQQEQKKWEEQADEINQQWREERGSILEN